MKSKGLEVWALVKKRLEKEHHKIVKEDIPLKTIEGMPIDTIEKELKALEIIIKKNVNIFLFKTEGCTLKIYNTIVILKEHHLTQEEYDLLKEVLL